MVDLSSITASPNLPVLERPVEDFADMGKTCLQRATLEAERRHCGNSGDSLTGADVVATDRELLALLLDPRTVNSLGELGLAEKRMQSKELLEDLYVEFGTRAAEHKIKLEATKTSNKAASGPKPAQNLSPETCWSSDEDSDSVTEAEVNRQTEPSKALVPTADELRKEFKTCFKRWRKACVAIDWKGHFPDLTLSNKKMGVHSDNDLMQMWKLDMGRVLNALIASDPTKEKFGHLPQMATMSRGSIGALLASSFCERINSAANIVLHEGNLKLSEEETNMLTTLRMNRPFVDYMRKKYPRLTLASLEEDTHSPIDLSLN